ncbi:hypothetical protein Tco_1459380 [Tanacetum coccineum]
MDSDYEVASGIPYSAIEVGFPEGVSYFIIETFFISMIDDLLLTYTVRLDLELSSYLQSGTWIIPVFLILLLLFTVHEGQEVMALFGSQDLCLRQRISSIWGTENDASEASQPLMGEIVYIRGLVDFDVTMSTSRGK